MAVTVEFPAGAVVFNCSKSFGRLKAMRRDGESSGTARVMASPGFATTPRVARSARTRRMTSDGSAMDYTHPMMIRRPVSVVAVAGVLLFRLINLSRLVVSQSNDVFVFGLITGQGKFPPLLSSP